MKHSPVVLTIDRLLADAKSTGLLSVWRMLAKQAAVDTGLPAPYLFERLQDQERRSPSGIGDGVAISSLRLNQVSQPYVLFVRTGQRIDCRALDNQPVDLFCLMLSNDGDVAGHLQRLAQLSRLMRDARLRANLRSVDNVDGLAALLLAPAMAARAA